VIGQTVSHYKILEEIGGGGMGVVYKAEDTKLERTVALKFLPPEFTRDKDAKIRFVREARAASALQHHNICTIHEIDETSDGRIFICMDYYGGETLEEKTARGPLPVGEVIDLVSQVAAGIAEAHAAGMVHRDVKPANIMVTEKGVAKILDFGLAKITGVTKVTQAGAAMGTVSYMSPEQARGEEADPRSDVWSLGVMVYELLAGEPPFTGEHQAAVMYAIMHEEHEPITRLRSDMPSGLETLIDKCMAKDREERYQTVVDLLADLGRCERETTVPTTESRSTAPSPARRERVPRQIQWTMLALIAVLVVVIGYRYLTHSTGLSSGERKMLVVLPFENLGPPEDEYFADGITEEITSRLAALEGLGVISRTSALQYKGVEKTARQIGEELKVDYILEGTVRWALGGEKKEADQNTVRITPQLIQVSDDTHLWSDQYDHPFRDIFAVQTAIAEQVVRQLDITLSGQERSTLRAKPTENLIAYQLYLRALDHLKYSHAPEDDYRNAQRLLAQAVVLDPQFALAYAKLSEAHRSLYFFGYDRTEQRLAEAKEAVDRALQLQPELPEARAQLGYYFYQGHLDYDRAFAELSVAAKSRPNDTQLLVDISYIWRRQGLFEEAIASLERASALSPNDPALTTELAYSYGIVRNYDKGIGLLRQSIAVAPTNMFAHVIKALLHWCRNGDLEQARVTLEAMQNRSSSPAVWCWYLQMVYEEHYDEALELLNGFSGEVLVMQEAFIPRDLLIGFLYSYMDSTQNAHRFFESARQLLEKEALDRPEDPRVHSSLGVTYAALGRKEEAIAAGKRGVDLYPVSKDAMLGPRRIVDLVFILAMVGEYDAAMSRIEYLLSIPHYTSVQLMLLDRRLDPLHEHPRFQRLLAEKPGAGRFNPSD
jgi:serine/threonine protein kinase/tetratricopeptide (TPR) repeat protein